MQFSDDKSEFYIYRTTRHFLSLLNAIFFSSNSSLSLSYRACFHVKTYLSKSFRDLEPVITFISKIKLLPVDRERVI